MGQINPINKAVCLETICETNYRKLLKLMPDLLHYQKQAIGKAQRKPSLQLDIIDRSRHTLTIQLSHCFQQNLKEFLLPEVKIRIYLDAKLAEVLRDCVRLDVAKVFKDPGQTLAILDYKWQLNYFLQKWLDHCLQSDYHFNMQQELA
jgi:uncharacterized protein